MKNSFESMHPKTGAVAALRATHTPLPSVVRTEGEKIRLATAFLERHNLVVLPKLCTRSDVMRYIGCSVATIDRLVRCTDFPAPFDVSAKRANIASSRMTPRWRLEDIQAWVESRKVSHDT